MGKDSFYCRYIKGTIDTIIAAAGILLFWWVYVLIAIAIKIEDPKGPVIFAQERLGKDGKVYLMYKFRSMKVGAEHTGSGVYSDSKDERVTKVGRFLRATSLDELPQIWNILVGEMSIIGPRPALWNQFDLLAERDKYGANDVRPGLTGLAQIMGRDELPIEIKAKYDGEYAQDITFAKDVKIFFGTITSVLGAKGVKEGKQ